MPRMFQFPWSTDDSEAGMGPASRPPEDPDHVLGWECANPALQCDGWEPAPQLPQAAGGG